MDEQGAWGAGFLVDQAWAAYSEDRYQEALAATSRAVAAAEQLDDPVLLIRALSIEAATLQMIDDYTAALARWTRIMGVAEDPATRGRLNDPDADEAIAVAYCGWVSTAQHLPSIPMRELFRVLDAGDRWLTATGHRDWRANILFERASVHDSLGESDAAIAAAEEALAVAMQYRDSPGRSLSAHRIALADLLIAAGRASEGWPYVQAMLDDPDSSPLERVAAHEALARCALAAGDTGAACQEARSASLLAAPMGDDVLTDVLDTLVEALQADGDLDAAWQAATRHMEVAGRIGSHYQPYYATRTAVDLALARSDLATVGRLLGELDEHATALDTATGTKYTVETARRYRRLASAGAGDDQPYQTALTKLTRAIDLDPNNAEAIGERGETYRLMGRYEEALTDLTRAIDLDPKYAWAFASRGATYRQMGRYEEALTDLTRAIDLDPKYAWAFASRGAAYRQMGRYEEALTDLTRAIDLDPKYAWAIGERGAAYQRMGRYEEALTDLTRAIDLDPKYAWAIGERGETYRMMGRYEEALTDLTRATELNPTAAWTASGRGRIYRSMARFADALRDFEHGIQLDSNHAISFAGRGETYRMMGKYEEALTDLTRAIDLDPEYTWAVASRGETYRLMGRYEEALAALNRALNLEPVTSPSDAWIIASRGKTYQALGRRDDALADFRQATKLDSSFASLLTHDVDR